MILGANDAVGAEDARDWAINSFPASSAVNKNCLFYPMMSMLPAHDLRQNSQSQIEGSSLSPVHTEDCVGQR